MSVEAITGYHAHIYFDEGTLEQATQLAERAGKALPVEVGRIHEKPVGPHPMWSCQLAFAVEDFDKVVPWLAVNRDGLTIFTHPLTGDDLVEHRDYAMWMGTIEPLKLEIFSKEQV